MPSCAIVTPAREHQRPRRRKQSMGLTLEEANRILRGTLAKAQELNIKISAAICDPGGRPIALQRMDNTMWADHPRLDLAVHRIPRLQRDLLAHADLDHRCDVRMVAVVAAMPNPSPSSGGLCTRIAGFWSKGRVFGQ